MELKGRHHGYEEKLQSEITQGQTEAAAEHHMELEGKDYEGTKGQVFKEHHVELQDNMLGALLKRFDHLE